MITVMADQDDGGDDDCGIGQSDDDNDDSC